MKYLSFILLVGFAISFGVFLYWIFTVLLPVAAVELTYQIRKTSMATFGTSDLSTLIFPQFRISIEEKSAHPEGAVVIPSIYLDEPIIYNVDPNDEIAYTQALKKGIAHASGTKLPGYGGLGYYFAHSSNPSFARQYNAIFYLLGKLKIGQNITLWHEGKRYDYVVIKTLVTTPEDISFLATIYPKETVVLQTCWPPGTSSKRLLVFAEKEE